MKKLGIILAAFLGVAVFAALAFLFAIGYFDSSSKMNFEKYNASPIFSDAKITLSSANTDKMVIKKSDGSSVYSYDTKAIVKVFALLSTMEFRGITDRPGNTVPDYTVTLFVSQKETITLEIEGNIAHAPSGAVYELKSGKLGDKLVKSYSGFITTPDYPVVVSSVNLSALNEGMSYYQLVFALGETKEIAFAGAEHTLLYSLDGKIPFTVSFDKYSDKIEISGVKMKEQAEEFGEIRG